MLRRRYIAQERGSSRCCNSASDGGCDVIVSRRNIGDDGAQHIKGSSFADLLLKLHIRGNLIQRHVTRAFDDHLNISVPCPLGQLR